MFKKITITEDNFISILERMQELPKNPINGGSGNCNCDLIHCINSTCSSIFKSEGQ